MRSCISSGDRGVLSGRVLSASRRSLTIRQDSVTGTLVKRDSTSKLTMMSISCMVVLERISTKCLELLSSLSLSHGAPASLQYIV